MVRVGDEGRGSRVFCGVRTIDKKKGEEDERWRVGCEKKSENQQGYLSTIAEMTQWSRITSADINHGISAAQK